MKFKCTLNKTGLSFIIFCTAFFSSCRKADYNPPLQKDVNTTSPQVAVDWMEQTRQLVSSEGKNPPQASRIYAYAAIALYQSVLPGMNGYRSLESEISGLNNLPNPIDFGALDFETAANEALYQVDKVVFGKLKNNNAEQLENLHYRYLNSRSKVVSAASLQNSVAFGKMTATSVIHRAENDNFSTSQSLTYTAPTRSQNPSFWEPTSLSNPSPLEPFWGKIKCFAMSSSSECEVPQKYQFSRSDTAAFYRQAYEVYQVSNTLTTEQKAIASWWADGSNTATPPGHWVAIENQLVTDLKLSLAKAVEMYTLVNIGMADAFISCWDAKYKFNLLRPETYIKENVPNAANWKPFIPTPPFPEYPSGHSVSSGVAAEILTSLFGAQAFIDKTNSSTSTEPRSFSSFKAAADEAAISRLYGGIHYRDACENGLKQGELVARSVLKNIQLKY